jgi:hypothetical protein
MSNELRLAFALVSVCEVYVIPATPGMDISNTGSKALRFGLAGGVGIGPHLPLTLSFRVIPPAGGSVGRVVNFDGDQNLILTPPGRAGS